MREGRRRERRREGPTRDACTSPRNNCKFRVGAGEARGEVGSPGRDRKIPEAPTQRARKADCVSASAGIPRWIPAIHWLRRQPEFIPFLQSLFRRMLWDVKSFSHLSLSLYLIITGHNRHEGWTMRSAGRLRRFHFVENLSVGLSKRERRRGFRIVKVSTGERYPFASVVQFCSMKILHSISLLPVVRTAALELPETLNKAENWSRNERHEAISRVPRRQIRVHHRRVCVFSFFFSTGRLIARDWLVDECSRGRGKLPSLNPWFFRFSIMGEGNGKRARCSGQFV